MIEIWTKRFKETGSTFKPRRDAASVKIRTKFNVERINFQCEQIYKCLHPKTISSRHNQNFKLHPFEIELMQETSI